MKNLKTGNFLLLFGRLLIYWKTAGEKTGVMMPKW